jgi:hypothetical protein
MRFPASAVSKSVGDSGGIGYRIEDVTILLG